MYFIIYTSNAVIDFDDDTLKALLIQARDKNSRLGVTGMLIYFSGKFIQLIEGEEDTVMKVYQDICRDDRHKQVITLKAGPIDNRFFGNWSMDFRAATPEDLEQVDGYKDGDLPNEINGATAFSLLKILSDKL